MQGPHFTYLKNEYVEALGLETFPVQRPSVVVCYVSENAVMPVTYEAFDVGVVYNHGLYVREHGGRSWKWRR